MNEWISRAVGLMHVNKITNKDIAAHNGWTPEYVSMILNGKKEPKGIEQRMLATIEVIIAERASKTAVEQFT